MAQQTPPDQLQNALDVIRPLRSVFVGQLDDSEMKSFNQLCEAGLARRVYQGAAGFMGLARIELT